MYKIKIALCMFAHKWQDVNSTACEQAREIEVLTRKTHLWQVIREKFKAVAKTQSMSALIEV